MASWGIKRLSAAVCDWIPMSNKKRKNFVSRTSSSTFICSEIQFVLHVSSAWLLTVFFLTDGAAGQCLLGINGGGSSRPFAHGVSAQDCTSQIMVWVAAMCHDVAVRNLDCATPGPPPPFRSLFATRWCSQAKPSRHQRRWVISPLCAWSFGTGLYS